MSERSWARVAEVLLAAFLLLLIPLAFHLPGPRLGDPPELIAWIIAVVSALRMIMISVRSRPRIVELAFWLFTYVFFGVAAVAQISSHRYPLSLGDYSQSQLLQTETRILVGMAAFVAGLVAWHAFSGGRRSISRWDDLELSESRCKWIGIVGAIVAAALVAKTGVKFFFESRDALSVALYNAAGKVQGVRVYDLASKATGGIKQFFLNVPVLVTLLYFIVTGLWRRHKALTVVLVILNIITNNVISNPRYWTGEVIVGVLAALWDLSKNKRHVYFVLGLLLVTVFGLSYLNVFRSSTTAGAPPPPPRSQQLVASADYGMFQQELNGTLWISSHGYSHGRQLAGAAFFFVPRSIWPGKSQPTGTLVEQEVGLNVLDSSSAWTEFYIDFGYPELILAFMLLGYLCAYLDDVFRRSTSIAGRLIVPMLATYEVLFLRGSLQPAIAFGLPIFVLMFVCLQRKPVLGNQASGAALSLPAWADQRGLLASRPLPHERVHHGSARSRGEGEEDPGEPGEGL